MQLLNRGGADVVAGFRGELLRLADENDGYWVLMDSPFELSYGLAVPHTHTGLLNEAAALVERMADSGLISRLIDRNHWAGVHAAEIRHTMSAERVELRRGGS